MIDWEWNRFFSEWGVVVSVGVFWLFCSMDIVDGVLVGMRCSV
jgi:hypothetical protein